tara:strand:+ start:19381 stop:19629 length:249 start_codon:yes stop_codon:yes gene_type:complete
MNGQAVRMAPGSARWIEPPNVPQVRIWTRPSGWPGANLGTGLSGALLDRVTERLLGKDTAHAGPTGSSKNAVLGSNATRFGA